MKKERGFTLIELLVVIAIIALLLAILMPSLKMAKEKAKTILCKSNLKGYHLAMKMYLGDNDAKFPNSHESVVNRDPGGGVTMLNPKNCQWHNSVINPAKNIEYAGALWPYLETLKSSLCQTFRGFAKTYGSDHPNHDSSIPIDPQYSYSQNNYLGGVDNNGNYLCVVRDTGVTRTPENVLLFVEETIQLFDDPVTNTPFAEWVLNDTCFMARHRQDGNYFGDTIATYHGTSTAKPFEGKGNTVFLDGHVGLSDPWDTEIISNMEFRRSYLLSFPKRNAKSLTKPY